MFQAADYLKKSWDKLPFPAYLSALTGTMLLGISLFLSKNNFLFLLVPAAFLFVSYIYPDYRRLFYLIFAVLPFSVEFYFDNVGLGTDLPSEPLMMLLTAIAVPVFIRNRFAFDRHYTKDPVFILLILHFFWIAMTALNSGHPVISWKYTLAKIWYLIPFFYLPLVFLKEDYDIIKVYRIVSTLVFVSICIVLVRHAMEGFSFVASYEVVRPFYRNHVTYAAISVICLPFVWSYYASLKEGLARRFTILVLLIFVAGIYFSYTRAAILSIFIAMAAYHIIRRKWMKPVLGFGTLIAVIAIILLAWNNRYLDFAPDYERTVTHYEFDNLLQATYKLEDISSMERVYRWMAGIEMFKERPLMGFGPATFYSEYKSYVITSFQTWVSNNVDQSGIHNYFLMILVEQGIPGLIIFLLICYYLLIRTEKLYHTLENQRQKLLVMAAGLSIIIILAMSLINDLIETDKVGPFFFFNAAILVYYHKKAALQ
ncbi:MAG: O-antigen ligase family protein [Saprospiraceae bacterium]|nr:O-antigen ligase family protein [Saprospiraceae bacterium]